MEGSERRDYVRPPVPSAAESARAGWLAPLIVVVMSIFLRPSLTQHPAAAVAYGIVVCVLILVGLACAVWGAYVALGWGPRKHLVPAAIGIMLNSFFVCAFVGTIWTFHQAKLRAMSVSQVPAQQIGANPNASNTDRYATEISLERN